VPDHDCPHPIESYDPETYDTWTCPVCRRVWEAHADIWWAPMEDDQGREIYGDPATTSS
jgi:hypothetical protein